MSESEYREIQVSSTLLVVVFLGVLALGVFIFLLGVSVGKKQVQVAAKVPSVGQTAAQTVEPVKEPSVPAPTAILEEPLKPQASGGETGLKREPSATPPSSSAKPKAEAEKSVPTGTGLYYVQVAALSDKAQAEAVAERFKKQGYTVVVASPRPSDSRAQYRVRLGGYSSRDRAAALLTKLNAAAGKRTDYFIVRD